MLRLPLLLHHTRVMDVRLVTGGYDYVSKTVVCQSRPTQRSALNIALYYGNGFPFLSLLFAVLQFPLDSRIRNQPEERGKHIQSGGNQWTHKREWDSGEIKHKG